MTVCPIAIAVGCKKCPVFAICPATRILGDQPPKSAETAEPPASKSRSGKSKK